MPEMRTPGVYIVEKNAFPNSVVQVATAVPAFIGHTEYARNKSADLTGKAWRISSMAEFREYFGGPPQSQFDLSGDQPVLRAESRFLLARSMAFFFQNGGGPCHIVSIGGYRRADGAWTTKAADDVAAAWPVLAKEQEPTMIVVPDAVLLSRADWATVSNAALDHCAATGNRIAILDVHDGDHARTHDATDVISGTEGFRPSIQGPRLDLGVAYYPWLHTSVVALADIDYRNLTPDARKAMAALLTAELKPEQMQKAKADAIKAVLAKLAAAEPAADDVDDTHKVLVAISPTYKAVMQRMVDALNLMPPSAAMAGVYTMVDNARGVFKAPANVGINSVIAPAVSLTAEEQEDLNLSPDGKSINPIRAFVGEGVLVWGARTLDGNSQDWRHVNTRRTAIMLEQSIGLAIRAYVFEPNDANTWVTVKSMIANFLTTQWKQGALAGATPEDAFGVDIGLGTTMTQNDILDGRMRVNVRVAVARPAEFIVLSLEQQMQKS